MTTAEKIEHIVDRARKILDLYHPKTSPEATDRIIRAWLRIKNSQLGWRSPLEMVVEDYPRLIAYMDGLAAEVMNRTP